MKMINLDNRIIDWIPRNQEYRYLSEVKHYFKERYNSDIGAYITPCESNVLMGCESSDFRSSHCLTTKCLLPYIDSVIELLKFCVCDENTEIRFKNHVTSCRFCKFPNYKLRNSDYTHIPGNNINQNYKYYKFFVLFSVFMTAQRESIENEVLKKCIRFIDLILDGEELISSLDQDDNTIENIMEILGGSGELLSRDPVIQLLIDTRDICPSIVFREYCNNSISVENSSRYIMFRSTI